MNREFHLSPTGKGRGVSCDAEGAFVGAIPILNRLRKSGNDEWQPRDCEQLSEQISVHYGLPIDMSSKTGGLRAIANALNEGDVARAQIATVLLGVPDPPQLSKRDCSRDAMIKLIRDLHWSGMIKWDADEHPRWPAGSGDSKGGQFAPKGEGAETAWPTSQSGVADRASSHNAEPDRAARSARIQLADNAASDASDDPIAEAVRAAAAAAAQRNSGPTRSQSGAAHAAHQDFWQALGSLLSHEVKSALWQIGQAEIAQSNNNVTIATDEANAVERGLKAYADYRAQLWREPDGRSFQVPAVDIGDPVTGRAELMARLAAKLPLTRPATNADWIDPLINLASLSAMAAGPAFRIARPVAGAIDGADVAALSANGATGYRATFGRAITNNYRETFFASNPELESQVVVHHAVPQRTLALYPDEVTESEIHSLENLRGIPSEFNSDMHLSQIAREWNQFYKANPNATQKQLLQKATEIDLKYGGQFKPPTGRGK